MAAGSESGAGNGPGSGAAGGVGNASAVAAVPGGNAVDPPENAGAAAATTTAAATVTTAEPRESARGAFLTSVDADDSRRTKKTKSQKNRQFEVLSKSAHGPEIVRIHKSLMDFGNTLDQRMAALLREHEKDFFLTYKTHMYTVQKEIKTLKMKADNEEAKTREDTKIKALEGELDWFMQEALRLDELCKGYKKEVDKWKAKADSLGEDRRFLEDQIKGAKRQNKILRAAAERARSSAYSALMATKARTEEQELRGGGGGGGYPPAIADQGYPALGNAQSRSEVRLASDSRPTPAGSGARAARSRTPDADVGSLVGGLSTNPGIAGSPSRSSSLARGGDSGTLALLPMTQPPLGNPTGRGQALGNEAEERYVEAVQHLKESIVREQQTVRMLQAARATQYSKKTELEEFFLKCIDEARRDLMRKRHLTMYKEKSEKERVLEAMLNSEDVLVCLYEKLFPHRTGIARSLGGPSAGDDHLLSQLPLEH